MVADHSVLHTVIDQQPERKTNTGRNVKKVKKSVYVNVQEGVEYQILLQFIIKFLQ